MMTDLLTICSIRRRVVGAQLICCSGSLLSTRPQLRHTSVLMMLCLSRTTAG